MNLRLGIIRNVADDLAIAGSLGPGRLTGTVDQSVSIDPDQIALPSSFDEGDIDDMEDEVRDVILQCVDEGSTCDATWQGLELTPGEIIDLVVEAVRDGEIQCNDIGNVVDDELLREGDSPADASENFGRSYRFIRVRSLISIAPTTCVRSLPAPNIAPKFSSSESNLSSAR